MIDTLELATVFTHSDKQRKKECGQNVDSHVEGVVHVEPDRLDMVPFRL